MDAEVKRLFLDGEIELLKGILLEAPVFKEHYPGFDLWLRTAVEESKKGKRLAFGVFISGIEDSKPIFKLVGGCILKVTEGYTMELKSLYIEEVDIKGLGRLLFNHIEEHCIKRGYRKIITDVPCAEQGTFWFLVQQGYTIDGRTDRYKVNDPCYLMSKVLIPHYTDDPFDWNELSEWFLKNVYDVTIKDTLNSSDPRSLLIEWKTGQFYSQGGFDDITAKGIALITDSIESEEIVKPTLEQIKNEKLQVLIVFSHQGDIKGILNNSNAIIIDEKNVREKINYSPYLFGKNDIKGMVVEIKPDYFQRIDEKWDNFVYFKGAPTGKYLKKDDKLFFFVGPTSEYVNGFIGGVGDIIEIEIDEPSTLWKKYEKANPIFHDIKEFDTFAEYKKKLMAIFVNNFHRFEFLLDFTEFKKVINFDELKTDDLGNLYLNNDMILRLYDYNEKKRKEKNNENLDDKTKGEPLREKIIEHLKKFKSNVEKVNRQAFWIDKEKLSPKSEEIGKSQLTSFIYGVLANELYVESRSGKGESDVICDINKEKHLFETKIWHNKKYVMEIGIEKLLNYMDAESLKESFYIVFVPKSLDLIEYKHYERIEQDKKSIHMFLIDISR
jgi:predicted transcriptional regulator